MILRRVIAHFRKQEWNIVPLVPMLRVGMYRLNKNHG
jgi:hypothetical protein